VQVLTSPDSKPFRSPSSPPLLSLPFDPTVLSLASFPALHSHLAPPSLFMLLHHGEQPGRQNSGTKRFLQSFPPSLNFFVQFPLPVLSDRLVPPYSFAFFSFWHPSMSVFSALSDAFGWPPLWLSRVHLYAAETPCEAVPEDLFPSCAEAPLTDHQPPFLFVSIFDLFFL